MDADDFNTLNSYKDENEESTWDSENPLQIEDALSSLFAPISLIGELDLSPESDTYLMAKSVAQRSLRKGNFESLPKNFPGSLVIFLVAEGIYQYREGAFWDQLSLSEPLGQNQTSKVGRAFLNSLEELGLETFEQVKYEENALQYVMPILLHGGIPRYSAPDLWKMMLQEIRSGSDEADQILARWNSRRSSLLTLDKPVQRFLRHGGSFAVDLLQRMIDLTEYVGEIGTEQSLSEGFEGLASYAGIPSYLAETLFEAGPVHKSKSRGFSRPRLRIDPYSGEGPSVILPPFEGANPEERWFIRWTGDYESTPTSRFDSREVSLEPSDRWSIALGTTGKEWIREGVSGLDTYFFDPLTGDLLTDQRRLKSSSVIALSSRVVEILQENIDEPLGIMEELPSPSGSWEGWNLQVLDLTSCNRFRVRKGGEEGISRLITTLATGSQPRLIQSPLDGVTDSQGSSIFCESPQLFLDTQINDASAWSVRFRNENGTTKEYLVSDLPSIESTFELRQVFGGSGSASGDLLVRGPLGSDLRVSIVIVPNLEISQLPGVISPEEEVMIDVTASELLLNGNQGSTRLKFQKNIDTLELTVQGGDHTFNLRVTIPRVSWFVRTSDGVRRTFDNLKISLGLNELENGKVDALLVRTRRESLVQLHLLIDGKSAQSTDVEKTAGLDGRWTFDLKRFATTAAQSGKAQLIFRLDIDEIQIFPLMVIAHYEVSGIEVESAVDTSERDTLCQISWRENRSFEDRAIWLWSDHRPWATPYRHAIDNAASGSTEIFVPHDSLPPGPYLLEVGLYDPWKQLTRPSSHDPNTARVMIGTQHESRDHLKGLNKNTLLDCLETVIAEDEPVSTLRTFGDRLSEISSEIGLSLLAIIDERQEAAFTHPVANSLISMIGQFPKALVGCLEQIALQRGSEDVNKFVLIALPDLLEIDEKSLDDEMHDRIWRVSLIAGAATDLNFDESENIQTRWELFTGWIPRSSSSLSTDELIQEGLTEHGLPAAGGPFERWMTMIPKEQIDDLIIALRSDHMKPLQQGAFNQAAFSLLNSVRDDNAGGVYNWKSRYSRLNDARARSNDLLTQYLDAVTPADDAPPWTSFLQDLLAVAVHLILIPNSRAMATSALSDALEISSNLVNRNLLIALAFTYWEEGN